MTTPEAVTISATTVADASRAYDVASAATLPASDVAAFLVMIERAARDPSIDIDKLGRLLIMRERENARLAEQAFCTALAEAQTEMVPVVADSNNPQTRSRYASYAALDRAVRPIYTKHGFGLTFNTDDAPGLEQARVVCDVCHSGGHTRRYRIDMPVDGKGARGGDVMTKTHAMGSGISYGMRYLLRMIFNLAIDQDDDGNGAGFKTRAALSTPDEKGTHIVGIPDADIVARRAAAQLKSKLPQYVVEPPKRELDRALDKQRHTGAQYEAQIKAEQRQERKFRQPLPQQYDERNPPPHDTIPDGPGRHAAKPTPSGDDGIPGFLDRRKPNGTEPNSSIWLEANDDGGHARKAR
jgi:ERF superfamily